jgi:serine/threonine-protein kinase
VTEIERFARLRELFHEAIELAAEDRVRLLAAVSSQDAAMAGELDELLGAHDEAGEFVGAAVQGEVAELTVEESAGMVGRRIGPWELERLLGRGGMGAVFLARRADGAFEQRVALKIIRPGFQSGQIVRRFRAERQALASLNHPNIARLVDGGATPEGLPYLAMEYVEGEDIESHCARRGLDLRERLELFRVVCGAVEHAHRNLIVHRDLKPGNILVTAEGVPKLLDFGVAKLLGRGASEETLLLTQGASYLTLAFGSPEQTRGEAVGTATDVYSLGAILYRLLAGRHPYSLGHLSFLEAARVICEKQPRPASEAAGEPATEPTNEGPTLVPQGEAELHRWARALRGDLDNVVARALRKEPERRYGSVAALEEDLGRHLAGLPVSARQDSWGYRTGKFVRRHRVGVGAAALVLLTLVGGLAATTWQAKRAREQARRAESERAKAEQVATFLRRMFSSPDASWHMARRQVSGGQITVAEVLEDAARRLGRDLSAQPELEATLRSTLGETYAALRMLDRAAPELERARDLDLKLHGEKHPETARAVALLGCVRMEQGRLDQGASLLDRALATYRSLAHPPPEDYIEALEARAYTMAAQSRYEEGSRLYGEAVERARELLPAAHPLRCLGLEGQAVVKDASGDAAMAEEKYRAALMCFAGLPDPDLMERSTSLMYLGSLLVLKREFGEAEPLLRQSLSVIEAKAGPENDLAAEPHRLLGLLYDEKGDQAAAETEVRRSIAIHRRWLPEDHLMVALSKATLGPVLLHAGRVTEAEDVLRQAQKVFERYPSMRFRLASVESSLGLCRAARGDSKEAERLLLASYNDMKASQQAASPRTQRVLRNLVDFYERGGETRKARDYAALLPPVAAGRDSQSRDHAAKAAEIEKKLPEK